MPKSVILKTKLAPVEKKVRGIAGPRKRGPAKTQAEIDQEKFDKQQREHQTVIQIRQPRPGVVHPDYQGPAEAQARGLELMQAEARQPRPLEGRKAQKILSELIQAIGSEVVDPQTGWTRIAAVIRKLYVDAVSGKTPAAALLFERGWGKVPQPVSVDLQAEVTHIVLGALQAGVPPEEVLADPVLAKMAEDSGLVVDGKFVLPHLGNPNASE